MYIPGYFEFCNRVKTISGSDALEKIPFELERLGAKRPLIITDKGVVNAGLIKILNNALNKKKGSGLKIGAIADNVPADSDITVVSEIARLYVKKGCDSIIAVGGGSPMDTAKGVNILASLGGDNLLKYSGFGKVKQKLNPMIAVPTTSGTGSEMTLVAVIADHEHGMKLLFVSYFLLPDVAILDPRMTLTLPPALTAATAMDAMTHAIEAYTCLGKNPLSDVHALKAIELISTNLLNVVKNPRDAKGRLALANGSALAGAAFSNSMVGIIHNLGHAVGAVCHVPHAVCMSILLPYGLEYNFHKIEKNLAELLFPLAGAEVYARTPRSERAELAITCIRDFNEKLHQATGGRHARFFKEIMNENGRAMVPRDSIPEIAHTAMGDAAQLYNPEEQDYTDDVMVLEAAWEGIPLDRSRVRKG